MSHKTAAIVTAGFVAVTIDASPFHVAIDIFRDKNNSIDLTSL